MKSKFKHKNTVINKNTGYDFNQVVAKVWALYIIYNVFSDTYYVGQTLDFANRIASHFNALKKNKHTNKPLQDDYNKLLQNKLNPENYIKINIIEHKFNILKKKSKK